MIEWKKALYIGYIHCLYILLDRTYRDGFTKRSTFRIYLYVRLYIRLYIHVYIYVHTYIYIYMCIHICSYMYVHTYTFICTYIRLYICSYIRIHTNMYVLQRKEKKRNKYVNIFLLKNSFATTNYIFLIHFVTYIS